MLCRCCFLSFVQARSCSFAIVSLHPHQLQVLHGQSGRAAPVQVDCLHIIGRTAAVTRGMPFLVCFFSLLILDYNLLIVSILIYDYYYVHNNV